MPLGQDLVHVVLRLAHGPESVSYVLVSRQRVFL
jgi:NADPH:quinone reductase-like Zn-dependent oxidoreductase